MGIEPTKNGFADRPPTVEDLARNGAGGARTRDLLTASQALSQAELQPQVGRDKWDLNPSYGFHRSATWLH